MVRSRTVPRRGLTLDFVMWIFTRVSGAALIILCAMGFIAALIMGARLQMDLPTLMRWTFFPNPSHVVNSNIPDVNAGWVGGYWRTMQLLIVFFGITHGFNGLRVVMEDYIGKDIIRRLIRWAILIIWVIVMFVAVYVIFTT